MQGLEGRDERWKGRSRNELYRNILTMSDEIRLERAKFAGRGIRVTNRVSDTTRRTRGKTGIKWVVELMKDWTELGIKVEWKENWRNKKHPPTSKLELSDREGHRNSIERHQ